MINRDTIKRQISIKAHDILTDNQDTIIDAIREGLDFATLERLDLERAFNEGMQDESYTLQEATNIIEAYGIISEMREGVTPSDAKKQLAADTFKHYVRNQIHFLFHEMVEAFDERKEDMEPANAALSAFEVCTKPKQAHDPVTQCFHCSANLFNVGVVEVSEGGTTETPVSFKNDAVTRGESTISNAYKTHAKCAKCNKSVDVDISELLDTYLNHHQGS